MQMSNENETPDSVAQFAADLRKLRLDADSPTLERLQRETGISRTVLSDAFTGRQLPSTRTVDRVVRACGGTPDEWIARRDRLAGLRDEPEAAADPDPRRSLGLRTAGWMIAAGFVGGIAVSALVAALMVPPLVASAQAAATPTPGAPKITVHTGDDPANTDCTKDSRVATGDTRADNSLLEIVWSDACQAGWGRITRYDGLYAGNTVTIAIYPQTAPDGPDRQEATEHEVQGAYTFLVVRPSPETLLCAEGSYTVDGKRIDLGDPLCI